jgi:hypothetical protein
MQPIQGSLGQIDLQRVGHDGNPGRRAALPFMRAAARTDRDEMFTAERVPA